MVAFFGVGLANGAFGTLAPVFAQGVGLPVESVALLVAGAIVGGAPLQAPVGRLSDRMDRRRLLAGIALFGATLSLGLFLLDLSEPAALILLVAVLGGAMHTLYPVAVAHANDRADKGDFVAVASGLLLIFGGGASVGPAVAAPIMQAGGPHWLFLFLMGVYVLIALHALWRTRVSPSVTESQHAPVALEPMQSATHEAMYLHPRADELGRPD